MRLIACILAMFAAASPASAQDWKTYADSAYSFSVAFPAEPKIETTTYPGPGGRIVAARVYSVAQDNSLLRMTVVDLKGAPVEDTSAIEHAVASLTQGSKVKVDTPHRVGSVYGRQLSIIEQTGATPSSRFSIANGGSIRSRALHFRAAKARQMPSAFSSPLSFSSRSILPPGKLRSAPDCTPGVRSQ